MGWPIEELEEKLAKNISIDTFSIEVQYSLMLFNILPDKIEGMNGIWLGKDYAGLKDIMDIYEIDNRKDVFEYLQICIREFSKLYNKERQKKIKKG